MNDQVVIQINEARHLFECKFRDGCLSETLFNAFKSAYQAPDYDIQYGFDIIEGIADKTKIRIQYLDEKDFRDIAKSLDSFLQTLGFSDIFWTRDINYGTLRSEHLDTVLQEQKKSPLPMLKGSSGQHITRAMPYDPRQELIEAIANLKLPDK